MATSRVKAVAILMGSSLHAQRRKLLPQIFNLSVRRRADFAILRRVKPLFLIDTDTASDDAVALIMALRSSNVRVLAITTVAGNVAVQQATRNALYTAELCGSSVPPFMGPEHPPHRPHHTPHCFPCPL